MDTERWHPLAFNFNELNFQGGGSVVYTATTTRCALLASQGVS
jgi:hypothetical protein